MDEHRVQRVSEAVREELSEIIGFEMDDPRLVAVDVTEVNVSPDSRHAHIKVAAGGDEREQAQALAALDHARHYLRHELARRLNLRRVPELHFASDRWAESADRVELLLKRAKKSVVRPKISPKLKQSVVVLFLLAAIAAYPAAPEMLRLESSVDAMGSTYSIAVYDSDRVKMEAAVEAAFDEVRRLDDLLSNYKPSSEWSLVNREAAQRPVAVSQELFNLLAACLDYSRRSEGAFDITVGPLMKVWGFYKGTGHLPHRAEVMAAETKVGYQHIQLDPARLTVRFDRAGVEMDPGGIGKGYAVDRMAEGLKKNGITVGLVSASGSSIYGMGAPPNEPRGWEIKIRDPRDERKTVETVYLKDMSLSTSGNYEKFFRAEGKIYSHIMDPRTGYPAPGMLSVSVLAPRTLDTEAWTKPFFINGRAWAARHKELGLRAYFCEDRTDQPCAWLR